MRKAVFLYLFFIALLSHAQSVTIQSDSTVCLNEFLVLNAQVTGTATSYAWDFGDGNSSTQASALHNYTAIGQKTVKLTVTFSGGTSTTDSVNIKVHDIPTAHFIFDVQPCFRSHQVCLTDSSVMGATTAGYSSRLVLWGDGARSLSNNPTVGDDVCYTGYSNPGTYTLDVEVVNDKGCENKWQQNITILPDFEPSFSVNKLVADCHSQKVCFNNDSTPQRSDIKSWSWDFGDGNSVQGNWDMVCHEFSSPGTYSVAFTVELQNGCSITTTKEVTVSFPKVYNDVTVGDTIQCYPSTFFASTSYNQGGFYVWKIYNADSTINRVLNNATNASYAPPNPGDYFISVEVSVGSCKDTSRWVPLRSQGVRAAFRALNNKQCVIEDTVYLLNESVPHPEARPSYYWEMGDKNAPSCLGYPSNCNFDTAFHSQHWYADTGCFNIKLTTYDTVSGCIDTSDAIAALQELEAVEFEFSIDKPCIGNKTDYGVRYGYKACDLAVKVCIDSLAGPTTFYPLVGSFRYNGVADPDGWVSVGFAMQGGDERYYRSHDLNDFYIDSSRLCLDTSWYHNWYQMHPDPEVDFSVTTDSGCLPLNVQLRHVDDNAGVLNLMKYTFDATQGITSLFIEDTIPDLFYTYTKEGYYDIFVLLEDSFGCYNFEYYPLTLGYFNDFSFDTLICKGDSVTFNDSIRYWFDNTPYWHQSTTPEAMVWDFDDGKGFASSDPNPTIAFDTKGVYTVRLASVDSNGCVDTAVHRLYVTGVTAAIRSPEDDYLCDQILQLFDSSYLDSMNEDDQIEAYYWDFGDGKTPSSLKDPFHYYSSGGRFKGTHWVRTTAGCSDTVQFDIYLKGPEPYFDIVSDTMGCAPFTAEFSSNSNFVSSLVWSMGDASGTSIFMPRDSTFEFTYTEPGVYYVYLEGTDTFLNASTQNRYTCTSLFPDTPGSVYRKIVVLPIPPVDFTYPQPLCIGQPVLFTNQSDTAYSHYRWRIEGNDTTTTQLSYTHVFKDSGVYAVDLLPWYMPDSSYQRSCYDSATKYLKVAYVKADFSIVDQGDCAGFVFTDSSQNAVDYAWDFGHYAAGSDNYSTEPSVVHSYGRDSGTYTVCLVVKSPEGCMDTACNEVVASYFAGIKLYNVFTPNNDQYNEDFQLPGTNFESFRLQIFNRWGERIFETIDPAVGWNGQYRNSGKALPASTYFYIVDYQFKCTERAERAEGVVELIR